MQTLSAVFPRILNIRVKAHAEEFLGAVKRKRNIIGQEQAQDSCGLSVPEFLQLTGLKPEFEGFPSQHTERLLRRRVLHVPRPNNVNT